MELSARQELMRHSDPKLTARYTHLGLAGLAGSVPALPTANTTFVPALAPAVRIPAEAYGQQWTNAAAGGGSDQQRFGKGKDCSADDCGPVRTALETEDVGFEPTAELLPRRFSRPLP